MKRLDDNAALILIDLQKGMQFPKLGRRNNPDAERHLAALLAHWRATARPVVHVRHISREPDSVFWPGQNGVEFQTAFEPNGNEHVVEKNVPDAFIASGLERWLRARQIAQVVIAGVITNNSVEATARTAGNLGFTALVASDAAFTFDMRDLNGRLWAAEDIHALSLANLAMDYAQIATTAEIVGRALRT
ncbi:cysteine hydrolase family protein [Paraburkholderia haematera]|jgi:Amidases related to nicotinamidase|uniref:Streptothricin hydrolase n=1 Tax=Paraburkholderia haematera TaxID=2793077 RepID=A0ABM8SBM7_9BURK|nr:cysteine hydrolase family protein [Paraburkholderia haematera]CAE6800023.1 Streptothricin hydrolase [Paraburkholderia haematera]